MTNYLVDHFYEAIPIAFFLINALIYFTFRYVILEKSFRYFKRFKLFALRDQMRLYVALGVLDEKSELFKHFDKLACELINNTENIRIPELLKTIKKHGKEVVPNHLNQYNKIMSQLKFVDKKISDLYSDLYSEIFKALIFQSKLFILKALIIYSIQKLISRSSKKIIEDLTMLFQVGLNSRKASKEIISFQTI